MSTYVSLHATYKSSIDVAEICVLFSQKKYSWIRENSVFHRAPTYISMSMLKRLIIRTEAREDLLSCVKNKGGSPPMIPIHSELVPKLQEIA